LKLVHSETEVCDVISHFISRERYDTHVHDDKIRETAEKNSLYFSSFISCVSDFACAVLSKFEGR
jgi:hypothetical protein